MIQMCSVLQSTDTQQDMDNAQPGAGNNAADPGKQGVGADDTHLDSGDGRSPPECSIAELDSPPPSEDSTSEAWPSGTSFRESSDDEIESRQPERARWQRKQRSPYSRERVTSSISKRQGSWRVPKVMWPRRLPQGSSKWIDWATITCLAQNLPLRPYEVVVSMVPRKPVEVQNICWICEVGSSAGAGLSALYRITLCGCTQVNLYYSPHSNIFSHRHYGKLSR
jgi:hypothetical protein